MRAPSALLLLLSGCTYIDAEDVRQRTDPDGDGLVLSDDCAPDDPEVGEKMAFYVDADGDGHGDPARSTLRCAGQNDEVALGDDCDDGDDAVYPDAEEVCEDGAINACDGDPYEAWSTCGWTGYQDVTDDAYPLYGEDIGDLAGTALVGPGDLNGDGEPDLLVGAPGVNLARGAVYVVTGPVEADGELADETRLRGDRAGDVAGYGLAGVGDLDADGWLDIAVGAPSRGATESEACRGGVLYLELGPPSAGDLADADASFVGPADEACTGYAAAGVGDQDDDGRAEVLVGSPDLGATDTPRVWLLLGASVEAGTVEEDAVSLEGGEGTMLGLAVAGGGDLDGDGAPDLAAGAPGADSGQPRVYVLAGGDPSALSLDDAAALLGEGGSSLFGGALAMPGDVDGDGLDDLLIAARASDAAAVGAGAVWLVRGPIPEVATDVDDAAAARITGPASGDALGASLAAVGDVDGDGGADALIGMGGSDAWSTNGGAVLLARSPMQGELDADAAGPIVGRDGANDHLGYAVASVGQGVGASLAMGAPTADLSGGVSREVGAALVVAVPAW